jgi:dihydroorotate dehydrogenase
MGPYDLSKPILFRLPPERVHGLAVRGLEALQGTAIEDVIADRFHVDDDRLGVEAFGQSFPNPVGLAAGFDKNAEVPRAMAALGFGHVEVGGVTATAQEGNDRPRLFRLPPDGALINRMGLNNDGSEVVGRRLAATDVPVPVGVNVAKSHDVPSEDAPADYRQTYEAVGEGGDFFVVNVSCPNAEDFRALQNKESLAAILGEIADAGASPLLVKLSPDLPERAVEDAIELVEEFDLDGIVATNTTTDRPLTLSHPNRLERGGLSGKPLEKEATQRVRFVAERTDVPVVGVGGVFTAEDAYRKIRAGASLVQLYTGLVYRGPSIAREINRGVLELLDRDGFEDVTEAVGADL